uniref:Uncharacterized protein n=1 Tax=Candidatus Kentrum sp. LPFa TaxID=2126335 RepID=A0A450XNH2_9GAMM|nr:MAG: hypothetical protein BECKLPF1236C_GA0070990_101172 [Candidatus Kentron sp. LPFa]
MITTKRKKLNKAQLSLISKEAERLRKIYQPIIKETTLDKKVLSTLNCGETFLRRMCNDFPGFFESLESAKALSVSIRQVREISNSLISEKEIARLNTMAANATKILMSSQSLVENLALTKDITQAFQSKEFSIPEEEYQVYLPKPTQPQTVSSKPITKEDITQAIIQAFTQISSKQPTRYDQDLGGLTLTPDLRLKYQNKYLRLTPLEKVLCTKLFEKEANSHFSPFDLEEAVYSERESKRRKNKFKKLCYRLARKINKEFGITEGLVYSANIVHRTL